MRQTHTYAVLKVTALAYKEIRAKLEQAGYGHAFNGDTVDMHGIAIEAEHLDGTMDANTTIELASILSALFAIVIIILRK